MKLTETLQAFTEALHQFAEKHSYLIENNISERSIAHQLAVELGIVFDRFSVDCEYNGNREDETLRKRVYITTEEMLEMAKSKMNQYDTYSVFPDIIIHTRDTNSNNHLVIEIKKRDKQGYVNKQDKHFDYLKLAAFTSEDQLHYRLGIYLEFHAGVKYATPQIVYFQHGAETKEPKEFK